MTYPTISIIIPRRADDSAEAAIHAALHSDYPAHRLEIIEVIGESPSKQRNMGAAAASGEILYFLDNDSIVTPTLLARVVEYYADAPDTLAGVGGPNLTPATDGLLQKTFGYALASPFAHSNMCARYTPTGAVRDAGEKELILCNLSIRRDIFLREQGFSEAMYPNEENEFINRLVKKGCRFLYDPDAVLYRSRRNRFMGFIKQLFHYGGGRAEQISVEGLSWESLLFFLPSGFVSYLIFMLVLAMAGAADWRAFLPLAAYGGLAFASALRTAIQERMPALSAILPAWYALMHLSYGIGMLHGFLTGWNVLSHRQQRVSTPVEVVIRKRFGTNSFD